MAFPNTKRCLHEVKNKVEPEHQQLKAWDAPCGPHFLVAPNLHPILRKNRQSTRGFTFKKMRLHLVKKHDKKQQPSTFGLGDIPVPGWIAIIWICLKVPYTLIWCFVIMFNIKCTFYGYPNFQTHPCGQSQILTATGWFWVLEPPPSLQHPEIPAPLRWNTTKTW